MIKLEETKMYGGTEDKPILLQEENLSYGESFQMKFFCPFNFTDFPFDSNTCCLDYRVWDAENMTLKTARILYGDETTNGGQIVIKNLPFPFEVTLESLKAFPKVRKQNQRMFYHTGMCLKIKRKAPYRLLTSFYYPTTAFALLSMLSFLINPDVVSKTFYCSQALQSHGLIIV